MAFRPIYTSAVPGFLLMEALLALLLLSSFSLIIGSYFHHIHTQYYLGQKKLQALSLAHNYIEQIMMKEIHSGDIPEQSDFYTIKVMRKELKMNACLITVAVSWADEVVQLKAVCLEKV